MKIIEMQQMLLMVCKVVIMYIWLDKNEFIFTIQIVNIIMNKHCQLCLSQDTVTFSSANTMFYTCSKCKINMCDRHVQGICHKCKEIYCYSCKVLRPWYPYVNVCQN